MESKRKTTVFLIGLIGLSFMLLGNYAAAADQYERNETMKSAKCIVPGSYSAEITTWEDVDYYRIQLIKDSTFKITFIRPNQVTETNNSIIYEVYYQDEEIVPLTVNDSRAIIAPNSTVVYNLAKIINSGYYYIKVYTDAWNISSVIGNYTLTVEASSYLACIPQSNTKDSTIGTTSTASDFWKFLSMTLGEPWVLLTIGFLTLFVVVITILGKKRE